MRKRFRGVRLFALAALVAGVVAVPSALADQLARTGRVARLGHVVRRDERRTPTAAGGNPAALQGGEGGIPGRGEEGRRLVQGALCLRQALERPLDQDFEATRVDKLSSLASVKAVYPVLTVSIPETETADPDLDTALGMTGADIAQSELGFDGTGVKVAVMDTGLDLDHPDLGGDGVPGAPHPERPCRRTAGLRR